jgi:polyferredoxin
LAEPPLPQPRPGLAGVWDRLVGPGTTRTETWLILGVALAGGLAVPLYGHNRDLGWTTPQIVLASLLAVDLFGGVVENATAAARRWHHRPGRTPRDHMAFVAFHGLHLLLVTWLFYSLDWAYFAAYYDYLLGAGWLMLNLSPSLRRPTALALAAGAVLLNGYGLTPAAGLEWVVPVLFLKVIVGYLGGD